MLAEVRLRRSIPKLTLLLESDRGATNVTRGQVQGRYFILNVANKNTNVSAVDVKVQILQMARSADGNRWQSLPVNGPVGVSWRRPQEMPDVVNVGPDVQCTFLSLLQGANRIEIPVLGAIPNNFTSVITANEHLRITFRAVADNARSKHLSVRIFWDGQWPTDDNVREHLQVVVE